MFNKLILYFSLFYLTLGLNFSHSQVDYLVGHDIQKGEELFKANCTSCHKLGDEKKARHSLSIHTSSVLFEASCLEVRFGGTHKETKIFSLEASCSSYGKRPGRVRQ